MKTPPRQIRRSKPSSRRRRPVYRRNVAAIVINDRGEIFVASRSDFPDSWQFPQGGVNPREREDKAVLRELREETGIRSAEIVRKSSKVHRYRFAQGPKRKYAGQAQRYFLVRFLGDDSEIQLDFWGHREFGAWKWMRPDEFPLHTVYPPRQPIYRAVFKELLGVDLP